MKAILVDRDGVLNELVYNAEVGRVDSPMNPDEFQLIPGAALAVKTLNNLGIKVIIISNQPGVVKGKLTEALFNQIILKMKEELWKEGAQVDGEYYCFHHPSVMDCSCRKPKPGLLFKAAKDYDLNLAETFMVGDGLVDVKAGKAAGCKTVLIGPKKCDACRLMQRENGYPDLRAENLIEAVKLTHGGE